jgi:signal transduction histidine kinase
MLGSTLELPQPPLVFYVLGAFLVVALGLVVVSHRPAIDARMAVPSVVIDVVLSSILLSLTDGPSSPLFGFFTFVILSAAVRWGPRGALLSAGVLWVAFAPNGGIQLLQQHDGDAMRFVLRAGNLLVVGAIIAYLGWAREQSKVSALRMELGKTMHDGILQELTAAGLQLKLAADRAPAETRPALEEVRGIVTAQQRRLRELVGTMRGRKETRSSTLTEAVSRIAAAATSGGRAVRCTVRANGHLVLSAGEQLQLRLILEAAIRHLHQHGGAPLAMEVAAGDDLVIELKGGRPASRRLPATLGRMLDDAGGTGRIAGRAASSSLVLELPLLDPVS